MVESAIILAGGRGTRLSSIFPNTPKPLVKFHGRPFIDWVILWLIKNSIKEVIVSTGYLGDKIELHLSNFKNKKIKIKCIREPKILGTAGGALYSLSMSNVKSKDVLIVNGDTLSTANLIQDGDSNSIKLWAYNHHDSSRYGTLKVDSNNYLKGFKEKVSGKGLINGGIYSFPVDLLSEFKVKKQSFEEDIFPQLIKKNISIKVQILDSDFIDIGTVSSYNNSNLFIRRHTNYFEDLLKYEM